MMRFQRVSHLIAIAVGVLLCSPLYGARSDYNTRCIFSNINTFFKTMEGTVFADATLPPGFTAIHASPLSVDSLHAKRLHDKSQLAMESLVAYANLDHAIWKKLVPSTVYSNAMVTSDANFVEPLRNYLAKDKPPIFLHGTSKEIGAEIIKKGPLLAPGVGRVNAGFFLDMGSDIAPGYALRSEGEPILFSIFIDPDAPTVKVGTQLMREFQNWLTAPETTVKIKKEFPELAQLLKQQGYTRLDQLSRDSMARALGAKVLINSTLYGQQLRNEIVVLDPIVVKGYKEIPLQ